MLFEDIIFQFLLMSAKMIFWSIKYTWVTKPKWLCHQSAPFVKDYLWCKFEIHSICSTWDSRAMYTGRIMTSKCHVTANIYVSWQQNWYMIKLFCVLKKPERKKLDMYTKTRSRLIITFVNNAKSTMT